MNGTDVSSNLVDNHLDWLVNSPDIISSELSLTRWQTHPSFIDNFQTPAFDADELTRFNQTIGERKALFLGVYCEEILSSYIVKNIPNEGWWRNLQINEDGRTIGELDLLLKTKGNAGLHFELATKFYLKVNGEQELQNYVGPTLNDRLDIKIDKLANQQCSLGSQTTTKAVLHELGIHHLDCLCHISGRLFYHFLSIPNQFHRAINHNHNRGYWCTSSELDEFINFSSSNWRISGHKTEWITEISDSDSAPNTPQEIRDKAKESGRPQMLISCSSNIDKQQWLRQFCFVVPDDWPNKAREFAIHNTGKN